GIWMTLTVRADRMTVVIDAPDKRRIGARHIAHQEIGGLYALRGQYVEYLFRIGRYRPIIEGKDDLMVVQRQRPRILHCADAFEIGRADRKHPAGAERVRIAGARLCRRYCATEQPQNQERYAAH